MKTYLPRVVRGGSWRDHPRYARVAFRSRLTPGGRSSLVGLRLVKSDNEVPDSGEGEKPDTTCSNGEHP
jgi:hypothetical protein